MSMLRKGGSVPLNPYTPLRRGQKNSCFFLFCKGVISESGNFSGLSVNLSPWHDDMASPQVADGGTASNMEGSCEYID